MSSGNVSKILNVQENDHLRIYVNLPFNTDNKMLLYTSGVVLFLKTKLGIHTILSSKIIKSGDIFNSFLKVCVRIES